MKKFNLFAIIVLVLSMLLTLCACESGEDDSFDTTAKPSDTTTAGQVDDVTPNDTTAADQSNDTTIPDQGGDTSRPLSTDNTNSNFGELHPPKPKD